MQATNAGLILATGVILIAFGILFGLIPGFAAIGSPPAQTSTTARLTQAKPPAIQYTIYPSSVKETGITLQIVNNGPAASTISVSGNIAYVPPNSNPSSQCNICSYGTSSAIVTFQPGQTQSVNLVWLPVSAGGVGSGGNPGNGITIPSGQYVFSFYLTPQYLQTGGQPNGNAVYAADVTMGGESGSTTVFVP